MLHLHTMEITFHYPNQRHQQEMGHLNYHHPQSLEINQTPYQFTNPRVKLQRNSVIEPMRLVSGMSEQGISQEDLDFDDYDDLDDDSEPEFELKPVKRKGKEHITHKWNPVKEITKAPLVSTY